MQSTCAYSKTYNEQMHEFQVIATLYKGEAPGLPLETEAPAMTPNGADFSSSFF